MTKEVTHLCAILAAPVLNAIKTYSLWLICSANMMYSIRNFREFASSKKSVESHGLPEGRLNQYHLDELKMSEVFYPVSERMYEAEPRGALPKGKIRRNLSLAAKLIESASLELAGEISTESLKDLVAALAVISQLRDELEV